MSAVAGGDGPAASGCPEMVFAASKAALLASKMHAAFFLSACNKAKEKLGRVDVGPLMQAAWIPHAWALLRYPLLQNITKNHVYVDNCI